MKYVDMMGLFPNSGWKRITFQMFADINGIILMRPLALRRLAVYMGRHQENRACRPIRGIGAARTRKWPTWKSSPV